MKKTKTFLHGLLLAALAAVVLASCSDDPSDNTEPTPPTTGKGNLVVLCEGTWGMDNSTLAMLSDGSMTSRWFQQMNPGQHLGDSGNDIIQVNDTMLAVSVNGSNIIQYIHPDGTAIAATEDIANCRCLATDGQGYIYVTSYADNGCVAKIDVRTKKVVATCRVGYEPEGITYWDGRLYVANTGSYGTTTGDHDFEQTVSVVDAKSMRELRRIDTGCINLYGKISTSGQYACINSSGNYYDIAPCTVVLDMNNEKCTVFDFPATYNCAAHDRFYIVGSMYSYATGQYEYSMHTISLPSLKAEPGLADYAAAEETVSQMQSFYGIYIAPQSGRLYASDARDYTTNGYLYEFSPKGELLGRHIVEGINPSKFVEIK